MTARDQEQISRAKLNILQRLGAATVHEAQGRKGAMSSYIKPIDPGSRMAGTALTVDACPGDNLVIHCALTHARPDDVLVVNAQGFVECGMWGDILTLAAQKAGVAGLVIDGAVRDAETIIAMQFPIFARGLSIKSALKGQPGRINVPIICGETRVEAGDVIIGDRDGIVVVSRDAVDSVIDAAERRERNEGVLREGIRSGASTVELLGLESILASHGMIPR